MHSDLTPESLQLRLRLSILPPVVQLVVRDTFAKGNPDIQLYDSLMRRGRHMSQSRRRPSRMPV